MSGAEFPDRLWPESLRCYDITLSTPEENLALDDALLTAVESQTISGCLRFWQPEQYFVVLGRSNKPQTEVDLKACAAARIPVFRRSSGGGTVVLGPGCLCYTLAVPLTDGLRSHGVSGVTAALMKRTAMGLQQSWAGVDVCGTSDLVRNGLKFSGNAQRWLRRSFLHHGTLLFDFDLELLNRLLLHPSREPEYRQARSHDRFVTNLESRPDILRHCIRSTWNAIADECPAPLLDDARMVAASRYASDDWKIWPQP